MYSQGVPYTSVGEVMQKRALYDSQALRAWTLPAIEIPVADLGIGIDYEFMGNMGNPYLGALGKQNAIEYYQPPGIEYVSANFAGDPTAGLDVSGLYMGSALVGTGVMGE